MEIGEAEVFLINKCHHLDWKMIVMPLSHFRVEQTQFPFPKKWGYIIISKVGELELCRKCFIKFILFSSLYIRKLFTFWLIIQTHLEKKTFVFNFNINVLNWLVQIKYSYEKVQWLIFRFLEWQIHFFLFIIQSWSQYDPKPLMKLNAFVKRT